MTLALERPVPAVPPVDEHSRVEGNDGLTDAERLRFASLHERHAGRQPSERVLSDVAEWLRKHRG